MRAHTHAHTHTLKGVASENIMAPYGIHGMRTNTQLYVIHCHLSKSVTINNSVTLREYAEMSLFHLPALRNEKTHLSLPYAAVSRYEHSKQRPRLV